MKYVTIYARTTKGTTYDDHAALLTRMSSSMTVRAITNMLLRIIQNYNMENYTRMEMDCITAYKILSCYSEKHESHLCWSKGMPYKWDKPKLTPISEQIVVKMPEFSVIGELSKKNMFCRDFGDNETVSFVSNSEDLFSETVSLSICQNEIRMWKADLPEEAEFTEAKIFICFDTKEIFGLESFIKFYYDSKAARREALKKASIEGDENLLKCLQEPQKMRMDKESFNILLSLRGKSGVSFNEAEDVFQFLDELSPCTVGRDIPEKGLCVNDIVTVVDEP